MFGSPPHEEKDPQDLDDDAGTMPATSKGFTYDDPPARARSARSADSRAAVSPALRCR